jgi:hypothetical protein
MTTSNQATSLQQALSVRDTTPRLSTKNDTATQRFESCFAQGLDLSEFAAPSTTSMSHSAALLQIKQSEALQRKTEEQEEERLQQLVRKRVQAVQQQSEEQDHGFVGALIGMHRTDPCVTESQHRHHRSNHKKRIIQKEKSKRPSQKVQLVKKSQRRKH